MWTIITKTIGYFLERVVLLGPTLLYRVLFGMGIGYGVYQLALPVMVNFVQQYLSGLPGWATGLLGALHVDDVLTLIFSAYAAKLGIKVRAIKLDGSQGTTP